MIRPILTLAVVFAAGIPAPAADEPGARSLRVLYVGNAGTPRARAFARFLEGRFTLAGAADRERFDPRHADGADVVLLDWSQRDLKPPEPGTRPEAWEHGLKSPLGERARWTRPTVLLGSAGHLLAAAWEVHGGSG